MIMKKYPEEMTKKELKKFVMGLKRRSKHQKTTPFNEFLKKQERREKRLKKV